MNRTELRDLARSLGLPVKGTNAEMLIAINAETARLRRSRSGMVIRAKGDKIAVFSAAAQAEGYRVAVKANRQSGGTVAYAVRGERRVTAAWTSTGAWDREATRVTSTGSKGRKLRNLAEALRELA